MIEGSPLLLALSIGALALLVLTYRPWRWLVCGHPFGSNPVTHRLERCHRKPFHRGPHLHAYEVEARLYAPRGSIHWGEIERERCVCGHMHATLDDAIACSFGADQ